MTDIFAQQGINFMSASMASTAPSANPAPITAPKIDMSKALANDVIPQVDASALQPGAPAQKNGSIPPPPAPNQLAANLAGNSEPGVSAAAGAAPPQPQAQSGTGKDIFANEGIAAPASSPNAQDAFSRGIYIDGAAPQSEEAAPVVNYANQVQQQTQALANLRFTPQQVKAYVNSPMSLSEAIQNQNDWPDIPALLQKYQQGQPMTEEQNTRLGDYADAAIKSALRGVGWDGNKAVVDPQMPAALVQYIQSGNSGKLPAGETAPPVAYQDGQTIMPPPYTPKVGEKPINAYAAVTDKGQQLMEQAKVAPATAAMKMVAFNDLPPEVKSALYDSTVLHDPNTKLTDLQTKQGYTKAVDALGEDNAAAIVHWYDGLGGVSFEQHQNAAYQGQMLPIMRDEQGNTHLDWRSGLTGPLFVPGDVYAGNIAPQDIEEEGRNMATNIAMMEFGNRAGAALEAKAGAKGAGAAPAASEAAAGAETAAATPTPTVDDYLGKLTPSKDQAMVKEGVVSVEGAKSNATVAAEQILRDKGLPPTAAQETVDNMTAQEKDTFVEKNAPQQASLVPNLAEPPESVPEHIKAQLLPDEPPPSGNAEADILRSQTAATNAANPPTIPEAQSGFNIQFAALKERVLKPMYTELFNDMQPIEDMAGKARAKGAEILPGEDSKLTANLAKSTPAWIERNWTTNTTEFDKAGNQVITGKGLKAIRDDFDSIFSKTEPDWKVRQDDMDAYREARTFLEDRDKGLSKVSNKDVSDSFDTLQRLAQKYGDDFRFFETFGREEVQWNNRILHNLVSSGLKTQAWYDDMIGKREWYSPTQRVIETDPEFADLLAGKAIGNDVTPSRIGALKERKGSELEVKNTFQSQLRNSAIILQKSAVNKLRSDIAKYADFYPNEVKVQRPAVIREAVQHSYDPKLRTKLEQLVDFLGGEVKRVDKIEGAKKGSLGAYDPNTKDVFLKPGTTEGTLTHEAGHMLDYVLGLKDKLLRDPEMKAELQKLAEDRLRSEIDLQKTPDGMTEFAEQMERAPASFMKYLKNDDEVLANFFDTWVNSPERLAEDAPKAKAAFEKIIDDNPQLNMLRDIRPSTARATEVLQRELLDQRGPKNSVVVYLDGARHYMVMEKELAKAFKSMSPMEIGMVQRFIGNILGASTKLLKAGATSLPEFMLKHFYRAIFTSFLNNPAEKGILGFLHHVGVGLPRAIFAVMRKNELYHEWASSSGSLRTFMDLGDKNLGKLQKEMFDKGDMGKFLNPLNWVKAAGEAYKTSKEISDYAPRIAVYKAMKDAGHSDLEAGLASLEATGNYIRHGTLSKRVNQWAPFFNDMVQGGDRFVRSQMRSPAAFATKAIATVLLPQLAITGYYLYAADDQTRKEYLKIPDFDRSMAMTVKIGDTWVKLPRAFAPGFVYGALTEKAMLYMYGKSHDDAPQIKNFWLKTIAEAATSVSPVFDWTRAITPMFKAWMEDTMNYSLFMQRPLFTGDKTKVMPADQSNQYTTETAKLIGKMFNISPINVDNTVYDMSGKAGRFAEQLSDMAINASRAAAGKPVNQREMRPADSPLYGGLVMDTPRGTNTENYQEFLSNLHDAQQAHNHINQLPPQEQSQFQSENHQLLSAYQSVNAANNQIDALQKQIRNINKDTNISGHDKTVQINHIQDTIGQIVEGANKAYRAATGGNK